LVVRAYSLREDEMSSLEAARFMLEQGRRLAIIFRRATLVRSTLSESALPTNLIACSLSAQSTCFAKRLR
jgi:hypothetical protein